MKLGEAKRRLAQIERRLNEYRLVLGGGPQSGLIAALEDCNRLLHEKQQYEKAIAETEAITELEGNPVGDVQAAYLTIQKKLDLLTIIIGRNDLDERLRNSLFEQLELYKDSRDSLEKGIEVCLWETDLLVE